MERIDISEDRRMADLVAAVERGEEVVIVREGTVVAEVRSTEPPRKFDMAALERFHAEHPMPRFEQSWGDLIRKMRDEDDH